LSTAGYRVTLIMTNAALALIVGLTGALTSTAMAASTWQKTHPRREQVNERLAHQNARIKSEVKEGDLTKSQAVALHKETAKSGPRSA
jgi:hypothetical protein